MTSLAPIMQGFFTETLAQRRASANTVTAYCDTFRLLLHHAHRELGKAPSALVVTDLDAGFVGGFLDHLESSRGNTVTTRNARLAAIHSLFRYAALRCPEHALLIQRVLAIPTARHTVTDVCYLTREETNALLSAPDRTDPLGRRDHLLLLVAVQTGLRVSELTSLTCTDVELGSGAHMRCTGEGRPTRSSRHAPADTSVATRSPTCWTRTSRSPPRSARPWPRRTPPRTPCGTPRPCNCLPPA
jgi:site-specific recombinase XerD